MKLHELDAYILQFLCIFSLSFHCLSICYNRFAFEELHITFNKKNSDSFELTLSSSQFRETSNFFLDQNILCILSVFIRCPE